jgi:nuclear pore complex protein Nup155
MPLYSAQVEDADGQGKSFWLDGQPAGDPRAAVWERRHRCYDLVLDSLGVFDEAMAKAPPRAPDAAPEGVYAVRDAAYELALGSEDEVFHSILYDWLITRGLADHLLDVSDPRKVCKTANYSSFRQLRPPYLEAHLKQPPATIQKYSLLWQFYVKSGEPLRAAETLGTLAGSVEYAHSPFPYHPLLISHEQLPAHTRSAHPVSHPCRGQREESTCIGWCAHRECPGSTPRPPRAFGCCASTA